MGRIFQANGDHILQYGLEEALLIGYLQHIIYDHVGKDSYFHEGRCWAYNTTEYFVNKVYPFWNTKKFDYIVKSLVEQEVIMVGNFNKNKFDRTRWYAFVDEHRFLSELDYRYKKSPESGVVVDVTKTGNAFPKNEECTAATVSEDKSPESGVVVDPPFLRNGSLKNEESYIDPLHKTLTNFRKVALEKSSPPPTRSEVILEKKGRGSRLSPTWELPEEYREWAVKRGLFNEQIDNQAERFKDHWISTTKNATKIDWFATWRVWLNNARDIKLQNPISPIKIEAPKPTIKNSSDPKIQKWYDTGGEGLDLKYGSGVWKSWFEPLVLVSFTKDEAVLKAPTRWMANEIKRRFIDGVFQSLKRIDPEFGVSSASVRYPEENSIKIICDE